MINCIIKATRCTFLNFILINNKILSDKIQESASRWFYYTSRRLLQIEKDEAVISLSSLHTDRHRLTQSHLARSILLRNWQLRSWYRRGNWWRSKVVRFVHGSRNLDCDIRVLRPGIAQSVQRLATGWTVRGSNPSWGARFSAPVQTGPGAHPASCTRGTGSFPGVKRPGRGADHPTPIFSAEILNWVELYLYLP